MHQQKYITFIGIGGGGGNILNTVIEQYPELTSTMLINRDNAAIRRSRATQTVLIKGIVSSEISRVCDEAHAMVQGSDALILLACLGGVTGSHVIAPIATTATALNIPVLAIVTLPFQFEGNNRMRQAQKGRARLKVPGVTLATFANQQLMDMADDTTTLIEAFRLVDSEVLKMISPYLQGGKTMR